MKSVIVSLSVLSLLVVVSEAWFHDLKSGKSDTADKLTSAPNSRKVILVAKKVYVPMYASDDAASAVADRLLPISPALTPSGTVTDGRQQPMAVDYSAMYLQPPPVASYAMYAPASVNVAAAYAAPVQFPTAAVADQGVVPQQYAVYPAGYGAAGPQFVQYVGAPPMSDGTWVMQYAGAGDAVAAGAPYAPTGNGKETVVADGSAVPVPTEAYANA